MIEFDGYDNWKCTEPQDDDRPRCPRCHGFMDRDEDDQPYCEDLSLGRVDALRSIGEMPWDNRAYLEVRAYLDLVEQHEEDPSKAYMGLLEEFVCELKNSK